MMSDAELNEMIDWCRNKIKEGKEKPMGLRRLSAKAFAGYEQAMLAVMSYLHGKKRGEHE